ncbi:hypothetical protein [Paenibacillus taichungensis]|uniref:hypothetical protein n=1 Tax=Paenibacillus taichungensis TaxID=484184 RepID=UPI000D712FF0|nr:hypothetical protein [Paenibacillus taichungensis]
MTPIEIVAIRLGCSTFFKVVPLFQDSLIEIGIKEGVTLITDDIVSDDTISHVDLIAFYKKIGFTLIIESYIWSI